MSRVLKQAEEEYLAALHASGMRTGPDVIRILASLPEEEQIRLTGGVICPNRKEVKRNVYVTVKRTETAAEAAEEDQAGPASKAR